MTYVTNCCQQKVRLSQELSAISSHLLHMYLPRKPAHPATKWPTRDWPTTRNVRTILSRSPVHLTVLNMMKMINSTAVFVYWFLCKTTPICLPTRVIPNASHVTVTSLNDVSICTQTGQGKTCIHANTSTVCYGRILPAIYLITQTLTDRRMLSWLVCYWSFMSWQHLRSFQDGYWLEAVCTHGDFIMLFH